MSLLADHAHGPLRGLAPWEWALFGAEALVFVWVLWLAIKWTLKPGEEDPGHVKRSILTDDALPAGRDPREGPGASHAPGGPGRPKSPP